MALINLDFLSHKFLNVVDDKSDGRKVTTNTLLTATLKKTRKVSSPTGIHAPEYLAS